MIKEVNSSNFNSFLREKDISVVKFWSETCEPCKELAPFFEKYAESNVNISFGSVKTNDNRKFSISNKVMGVPTVIIYKEGVEIGRLIGENCTINKIQEVTECK